MSTFETLRRGEHGARRNRLVSGWFFVCLVLSGCTGTSDVDARPLSPETTGTTGTTKPDIAESPRLGPIPVDVRVALPAPLDSLPGAALTIDLVQAAATPSVDEAPVEKDMLLAQLNLFSTDEAYDVVRPGPPYLLTETGEWRGFDLARYGLKSPAYGELSMAISSDGRRIALADAWLLVTVDLLDNTFSRFGLPVHHAIALQWSSDAATVFLKDRNRRRRPCGPTGCALNVSAEKLSVVPFDLFNSAVGNDGSMVELSSSTGQGTGEVITHIEGQEPIETPLRFLASTSTAGAPAAARDVAYSQCVAHGGGRDPGVVIVDIASGDAIAMLTRSQRHICRLVAEVWLTDRHLLVGDGTSGDLWLWDVQARRVRQVGAGLTSGVNLAVASRVVSTRLARLPRR